MLFVCFRGPDLLWKDRLIRPAAPAASSSKNTSFSPAEAARWLARPPDDHSCRAARGALRAAEDVKLLTDDANCHEAVGGEAAQQGTGNTSKKTCLYLPGFWTGEPVKTKSRDALLRWKSCGRALFKGSEGGGVRKCEHVCRDSVLVYGSACVH